MVNATFLFRIRKQNEGAISDFVLYNIPQVQLTEKHVLDSITLHTLAVMIAIITYEFYTALILTFFLFVKDYLKILVLMTTYFTYFYRYL